MFAIYAVKKIQTRKIYFVIIVVIYISLLLVGVYQAKTTFQIASEMQLPSDFCIRKPLTVGDNEGQWVSISLLRDYYTSFTAYYKDDPPIVVVFYVGEKSEIDHKINFYLLGETNKADVGSLYDIPNIKLSETLSSTNHTYDTVIPATGVIQLAGKPVNFRFIDERLWLWWKIDGNTLIIISNEGDNYSFITPLPYELQEDFKLKRNPKLLPYLPKLEAAVVEYQKYCPATTKIS